MAKKQSRQPNAAAKSSKKEQICKIHANLVNSQGVVVLSDPTFGEFAAGNRYLYKNSDNKNFDIFITEKVTNADSGGHTWFKVIVNGTEYDYQDIQELKKIVGCTYTRKYGNKGDRGYPKTEEQAANFAATWTENLIKKVSDIEKILDNYNFEGEYNFEGLKQFISGAVKQHAFNLLKEYKEEVQEKEQAAINKERKKNLEKRIQGLIKEGKYDEVKKILEKLEKL